MKVRDTSRGRMYAVSSNTGCTVINGDMAVDIPAGDQSVILALDKKLIIDGDDAAKFVEVRWGTNAAAGGSRPAPSWIGDVVDGLTSIVGEGKFDINYIPGENKLYLQFSLEVTNEQITEVKALLTRVLPEDLVLEAEWENGLPIDYTPVEYLESTGTQYIDSGTLLTAITSTDTISWKSDFVSRIGSTDGIFSSYAYPDPVLRMVLNHGYNIITVEWFTRYSGGVKSTKYSGAYELSSQGLSIDGTLYPITTGEGECTRFVLFSQRVSGTLYNSAIKLYSWTVAGKYDFVPCLDDTGAPCMYDKVSKTTFYSAGSGDFIYLSPESATTYSLRRPVAEYAKLTPHGVRRLYKLPDSYTGEAEQYIAENGFKRLVEPPKPEDGYWTPVWHDREDRIELEWVETEPPAEEELQIEEIENA